VTPDDFAIVRDGKVVDYQTNREQATALTAWYQRHQRPVRSHGCASASDASGFPLIRSANLHMHASGSATFDELVSRIEDGYAIVGGAADVDHQQLTGQGMGELVYRVRKGKILSPVSGAAYMFRSPELWRNLSAIGGPASVARRGFETMKGQPNQFNYHSVSAPAAIIKNIPIINFLGGPVA
jgi:TldD protein